jgi:TP901-1 family phage major tail protein
MAIVNATNLVILNNSVQVDDLTNCTLTVNMEVRDATTKSSSGYRDTLEGVRSWSGSGECLVDTAATEGYTQLYDDIIARTAVTVKFTTGASGNTFWSGSAYLTNWELSGGVEDNVTLSYAFEGTGSLTKGTEI